MLTATRTGHRIGLAAAAVAAAATVITGCSAALTGTPTRVPPTVQPLAVGDTATLDVATTPDGAPDMADLGSRALDLIPGTERPNERLWCVLDAPRGLGLCITDAADYAFQFTTPTDGRHVTLTRAMAS